MHALKGIVIILWIIGCALAGALVRRFNAEKGRRIAMQVCARGIMRILGMKVEVEGTPAQNRPLLLVTNHCSYLDILVLASTLPVVFTPKAEIAGWFGIGMVCRLTGCVFIDRRVSATAHNRARLRESLEQGNIVCLFPEGTTNDGRRVLPFRSSYFSLAEERFAGAPLTVQGAAIEYTHLHGLPLDRSARPRIAWYGDMELMSHVGELLKLGPVRARLTFCATHTLEEQGSRKELSRRCQEDIAHVVMG